MCYYKMYILIDNYTLSNFIIKSKVAISIDDII